MTDPSYRELVHAPADLALEYVQWAKSLRGARQVPFGIPIVDAKVVPFHPGDMVVFCARPGHAKTSILAYLARAEAKRITERGETDRVVVYVTFEQVAEEIESVFQLSDSFTASDLVWGRVPIEDVERNALKRAALPIFIIGNSLARTGANSPRMYPEIVFQAIESLEADYKVKPSLILIDYIQLIPVPHQADRHKQVIEAAYRVKEIAQRVGCPAAVAVQARREVDSRDVKIPGLWDAQWSSAIEQTADKFFSLWRPWLTESHIDEFGNPTTVTIDNDTYPVTKQLLVMSMLKQRFEDGRHTWGLHFDPRYLKLCAIETDIDELYGGRYQ
jgi:replicative DNA helicase